MTTPQTKEYLYVSGASCVSCLGTIQGAVTQITEVDETAMNLAQSTITVTVTGQAPVEELVNGIKRAGYDAESITDSSDQDVLEEREKVDHIDGDINIPYKIIGEEIGEHATNKDTTINVYCQSEDRAEKTTQTLEELGYLDVISHGSIDDVRAMNEMLPQ